MSDKAEREAAGGTVERIAEEPVDLAVIGGGPAGLAAAEAAAEALGASARIVVFEAKPSLGRKLLMAGKSGLNITHSEPFEQFQARYRDAAPALFAALEAFPPGAVRTWMEGLGQESFTGSSGRVFPKTMKASPLLRSWLARLGERGVEARPGWRWRGLDGDALFFETQAGPRRIRPRAVVFALGGASWPRLGSDGAWAESFRALGVETEVFRPSNIGWRIAWSEYFKNRFAGAPLKNLRLSAGGAQARGELTVTRYGLEGGPIYTLTPELLAGAPLKVDLTPDRSENALVEALAKPRGKQSLSSWLRKAARLDPVKIALLREPDGAAPAEAPEALAERIKALSLSLEGPRPIEEAISTAGGLPWSGLSSQFEILARPGWYAAGEMIAWDAPTGGYLLTACLATGRAAGRGAASRLASPVV